MAVAQVRDVAALAGVSAGTVSNALNHPSKVSPSTLTRIQAAIDELGYIRNDAARQLRVGTNRAIGMIVLDIANPFFTDVARGVEDTLIEPGRPLILGNSAQQESRETTYLDLFEEQHMSGVLITPVGDVMDRLRRLRDRGTSVVLVDRLTQTDEFSSVSIDDQIGGRLATEHLLEIGRRRIGFIGGPTSLSQVGNRLSAARAAVEQHGGGTILPIESAAMDVAAGRSGMGRLLDVPIRERPDAVFAANDMVALGVLQALTLAGVRVPDDIAIVGYDDIDFAASAAIPLTSVRQPARQLGSTAASLLLEAIASPERSDVRHVMLEPELVVRQSTSL
ncbi:LacI family DNA-binding transcriptional regulator [Aeromicrobium fastidiosum]|uniref:LacI family transcriptional regulator n=1 Tax=Aeromicrobium fastidiosum TaxID=52699 RepID=A0A641ARN8_9ACTN|nr:LacI family DNA-binding transcriptional regulator [Aeromicrobium fastidiosum]KAA1380609.1 LacI family transcriptional regulator [Aeromicrobium fastidiosum]MBP2390211.1 LacI family transcriptional regulator [Aeromicrobium fastidiosum]